LKLMKDQRTIRSSLARWGVVFLGWTAVGLFFAGKNVVVFINRGSPIQWSRAVTFELIYWYVWALFTPLILWFARRFSLKRGELGRGIVMHLLFGLLVAPSAPALEGGISLLIEWRVGHASAEALRAMFPLILRGIRVGCFDGFITFWVIVGIFYVFDYYKRYRERELRASQLERRLAEAELENLRMQLQPHFLFNTLHAISVLMSRDVPAAKRMLVTLSDLLRITLDSVGAQEVPLKDELDFVNRYLEIEQARFQDRLTVKVDVAPDILSASVPNLVLQPLVENAIRHGITVSSGPGVIEISAVRDNDHLKLRVKDNGPGLKPRGDHSAQKGIGLANSKDRLKHLYGSAHSFEVAALAEGGTLVTVAIPFHKGSWIQGG
jgi:two-component system LytT family sensor kinase